MAEETYQSLYRRYRPARFSEVLGQDHVTHALRNAVRDGRVSQGYLFSGPRGTGKTSTARILAKALNCEKLDDGEPCGVCASCTSVAAGSSFDSIEMDAASNNGVDAMRDLVSRASLGTTGLRKVYIIDEVHMLSTAASNTLLKTLEEPPAHVVFVLATTDPQKVLPTIISRVQHFQFHLLPADTLGALVRSVNADAGLGLADEDLDKVVRRGAGSARDALSVLDQAAALGGADDEVPVAAEVLEALVERDAARALAAVASGCAVGRDPRHLAEETLAALRDAFLAGRAPALVDLPAPEVERAAEVGRKLGPAALVRAMEVVGAATADMREALDPRTTLEVALVRITAPEADASPGALLERIERLERRMAGADGVHQPAGPGGLGVAIPHAGPPSESPEVSGAGGVENGENGANGEKDPAAPRPGRPAMPTVPAAPPRAAPARAAAKRPAVAPPPPSPGGRALGSYRGASPPTPAPQVEGPAEPDTPPAPSTGMAAAPAGPADVPDRDVPDRDELTKAWGDVVLAGLRGRTRALYAAGRFVAAANGRAVFALPDATHRDRCIPARPDVERALAEHFGRPVPVELVADAPPTDDGDDDSSFAMSELRDAPKMADASPADRVKNAFPGAEEVTP